MGDDDDDDDDDDDNSVNGEGGVEIGVAVMVEDGEGDVMADC